jgi:PD-(D/E)XK nuclease superfamily domain
MEQMIIPALRKGGYSYSKQVDIGKRPGGGRHKVDYVVSKQDGNPILLSVKGQSTGGTAEQKVAFEVISLIKALKNNNGKYSKAYIVLGGEGWKLRDFYVHGGLDEYLRDGGLVKIMTLESFVAVAQKGSL